MPIAVFKHETNPATHSDRVVLKDHFGNEMELTIHPFIMGEDEVITPVDVEAEMEKAIKIMAARERAYFEHLMKRHANHPLLLSHPEHPNNKALQASGSSQVAGPASTGGCGCE
jgi:hypothetical protein